MRIEYHPAVEQDVAEALQRYDAVLQKPGEEFKAELRRAIKVAAAKPGRFHLIKPGVHRANPKRFPYHVVYRELADGIRVTQAVREGRMFLALRNASPRSDALQVFPLTRV